MVAVAAIALGYIALASVATLALTILDKVRARRRGARVPERVLLLAALVGGSPGLVAGMLVARHKTRKASFLAAVALVLTAQAAALWLLLRP